VEPPRGSVRPETLHGAVTGAANSSVGRRQRDAARRISGSTLNDGPQRTSTPSPTQRGPEGPAAESLQGAVEPTESPVRARQQNRPRRSDVRAQGPRRESALNPAPQGQSVLEPKPQGPQRVSPLEPGHQREPDYDSRPQGPHGQSAFDPEPLQGPQRQSVFDVESQGHHQRQSSLETFDPGPQRTSTPSPTHHSRRESFPAAGVTGSSSSRSRPVFQPVLVLDTDQHQPAVQVIKQSINQSVISRLA